MTFDELRATIKAEIPPDWDFELLARAGLEIAPQYSMSCWRLNGLGLDENVDPVSNPEALLAAWRELKGRLG